MRAAADDAIEIDMKELKQLLERARTGPLSDEDYRTLKGAIEALGHLIEGRRREYRSSEKSRNVLASASMIESATENEGERAAAERTRGHGRNGAEAYRGAERIKVAHEVLKPGDCCPECPKGKVYRQQETSPLIRIVGRVPIQAKVWELEKLRCNACGEVFTADPPEGVGAEKYDATAASMIAVLKYGTGLPFHRLQGLQENLGIPLPASTQWEIVEEAADVVRPVYAELIRQAAQGEVLHNDDTSMKVLSLQDHGRTKDESEERTGVFTSGVVSTREGHQVALFFTGRRHAGENLAKVLAHRVADLAPPIQMCDALSRNLPKEFESIVANCIAHARRYFVDVVANFPEECRHVLETLGEVFRNDALAREQGMTPEERLRLHKERSGPLMEGLQKWCADQLLEQKVEPNSGLGRAVSYMLRHWEPLTLFLRKAGAPLENNICERALKKAILHRKNSLFYKTENGARVGDTFMSLVHTCELCRTDAFDYITELLNHPKEIDGAPSDWMPWNYRGTLERDVASPREPG